MALPIYITSSKDLQLMQNAWSQQINPVIELPTNQGIILENVILTTGDNVINHKLGRKLQGWQVVRMQDGFVQLYDKQNSNQMSNLTLVLNSSGTGKVNLFVF